MKKIDLIHKLIYLIAFISVIGSIIIYDNSSELLTWKVIAFLWMCSSYINELRIKNNKL